MNGCFQTDPLITCNTCGEDYDFEDNNDYGFDNCCSSCGDSKCISVLKKEIEGFKNGGVWQDITHENEELKKEIILLKEMNEKLIRLIGKEISL